MTSQQNPRDTNDRPDPDTGEAEAPAPDASTGPGGQAPEDSGSDVATDAAVDPDDDLQARLAEAEASAAEHRDLYLRARAEADNIRRRAENEVANARKFAVENFAREMLAVRDSLELARSAEAGNGSDAALDPIREGLELTLRLMDKAFASFGVEAVAPQRGDRFDPERHQAMSAQPTGEVPPNHIVAVIQGGYRIHERLLRPAMVIVARSEDSPGGNCDAPSGEGGDSGSA